MYLKYMLRPTQKLKLLIDLGLNFRFKFITFLFTFKFETIYLHKHPCSQHIADLKLLTDHLYLQEEILVIPSQYP